MISVELGREFLGKLIKNVLGENQPVIVNHVLE
jgi:hypothetical protein